MDNPGWWRGIGLGLGGTFALWFIGGLIVFFLSIIFEWENE